MTLEWKKFMQRCKGRMKLLMFTFYFSGSQDLPPKFLCCEALFSDDVLIIILGDLDSNVAFALSIFPSNRNFLILYLLFLTMFY